MFSKNTRSRWTLLVFLIAGIVLGAFLGDYLGAYLPWLAYGLPFGVNPPFTLSLGVLSLTFGILFKVNIGSLIGIVLAIVAFKLSARL